MFNKIVEDVTIVFDSCVTRLARVHYATFVRSLLTPTKTTCHVHLVHDVRLPTVELSHADAEELRQVNESSTVGR